MSKKGVVTNVFIVLAAFVVMAGCIFIGRKIFISFPTGEIDNSVGGWIFSRQYIYVDLYMAFVSLIVQCIGIAVFDMVFFRYYLMYYDNKVCKITMKIIYIIIFIIRYFTIIICNSPIFPLLDGERYAVRSGNFWDRWLVDEIVIADVFGILYYYISFSYPILIAIFVRWYKMKKKIKT